MADFSALKTSIQNYIKENGNEEITGNLLQQILLSMVTTLGDSAINDLVTALNAEIANRGNADTTLQGNINSEATTRANADTELGGRITTLQGVVNGIKANVENGYVYAGIATPSSTPASGKVFYLALTAGTYTNFGATVVQQGINILKYNGSAWSLDSFLGLDDAPTQGSNNLVKSGGVLDSIIKDGSAFDLSAYNNGTTYADLSAALTALNALPAVYKKGGMSVKYVQTSDNKYIQYRLMATTWSTTVTDWQGVDTELVEGSHNLAESGAVKKNLNPIKEDIADIQESLSQNDYYVILESGSIGGTQGTDDPSDTAIRCRNYISISSDPTLIITKNGSAPSFGKRFYDSNKEYLGTSYAASAVYLRFVILNTTMSDEANVVVKINGDTYAHSKYEKVATDKDLDSLSEQVSGINERLLTAEGQIDGLDNSIDGLDNSVDGLTVGFDEVDKALIKNAYYVILESGSIGGTEGKDTPSDTIIRCRNYISISSDVSVTIKKSGVNVGGKRYYNSSKEYLGTSYTASAAYLRFVVLNTTIADEPNIVVTIDGNVYEHHAYQTVVTNERMEPVEKLVMGGIEPQQVLKAYVSNANITTDNGWTTVIAQVSPNQTVNLVSVSTSSVRYMLYSSKPSVGDNSAITVGTMVTGSTSAQIPNELPFYYIAFSIQHSMSLESGIYINGEPYTQPNISEKVDAVEEQVADLENEISVFANAFERALPKLDYGDLLYRKCPNFINAMREKKKDVTVCLSGTSLTQGNLYVSQRSDKLERPPLLQGYDLSSAVFDTLIKLWPGQQYRRFDHPSVTRSTSEWINSASNDIWDDSGNSKNGYTGRTKDANAYISITVPSDAWRFNFIYRTDSEGGTCTVSIAEGNDKMEVYNGSAWVEANGYEFSMLEPPVTTTKGNTCFQKRLNMRCKNKTSGGINSIGTEKTLTISKGNDSTTSFNVVGFEWSHREFMLTVINGARGGHCWGYQTEINVPAKNNLEQYQDLDLWEFNPDLILCEVTAINWAAGSERAVAYDPNWFVNLAKRHYYNEFNDCSISLYAKSNGYQDCEIVFYGDTLSVANTNRNVWDENGNQVFGTVVNAASNGNPDTTNVGRVKTGVENYDAVDSYMMSKQQLFIPVTERIIDFAQKVYGSYPNAFAASGASGNTLSYDTTHLNDRGVRLWSSFILPLFNF